MRRRAVGDAAAPGRRSSTTSAIVKSVHTDQFNHAPAQIFFNTGFSQPGRPSLGSWVIYGLGSETQRPARVRRHVHRQRHQRRLGQLVERLPAHHLHRRSPAQQGDPILNVSSPPGVDARLQRDSLDLIGSSNTPPPGRRSATPRSPPASPPTRWPSACRHRPRS